MPTRFSGANSTLGLGHEIREELPGLALHPGARASYPLRQASLIRCLLERDSRSKIAGIAADWSARVD
jgi:hypothetical protein